MSIKVMIDRNISTHLVVTAVIGNLALCIQSKQ